MFVPHVHKTQFVRTEKPLLVVTDFVQIPHTMDAFLVARIHVRVASLPTVPPDVISEIMVATHVSLGIIVRADQRAPLARPGILAQREVSVLPMRQVPCHVRLEVIVHRGQVHQIQTVDLGISVKMQRSKLHAQREGDAMACV